MTAIELVGMVGAGMVGFVFGNVCNQVAAHKRETPEAEQLREAVRVRALLTEAGNRMTDARLDQGGRLLRATRHALEVWNKAGDDREEARLELEAAYYAVPVEHRQDAAVGIRVPPPDAAR